MCKKGVLIIRIGRWGPVYYNYNKFKEPPKILEIIIKAPVLTEVNSLLLSCLTAFRLRQLRHPTLPGL